MCYSLGFEEEEKVSGIVLIRLSGYSSSFLAIRFKYIVTP